MGFGAMLTLETGRDVAAFIHEVLEQRQVLHAEHDYGWEGGGGVASWDVGVDVRPVLHQQTHHLDGALPRCHQERVKGVQVGVGPGLQEHGGRFDVVVDDCEVQRGGATVLVHDRAFLGQPGIDVEAGLDQDLQDLIIVVFGSKMEGANTAATNS